MEHSPTTADDGMSLAFLSQEISPDSNSLIQPYRHDLSPALDIVPSAIDQSTWKSVPPSSDNLPQFFKAEPPLRELPDFENLQDLMSSKQPSQFDPTKAKLDLPPISFPDDAMQDAIEEAANPQVWMDMVLGESTELSEFPVRLNDSVFINANQSAIDRIFSVLRFVSDPLIL
jgi:hypothetical protein